MNQQEIAREREKLGGMYQYFASDGEAGLKTEIIADPDLLQQRQLDVRHEHNGPVYHYTHWYRGLIDKNCFPDAAAVGYKPEGLSGGPETIVEYDRIKPQTRRGKSLTFTAK